MIPVIDMHCDTISSILNSRIKGKECSLRSNSGHLDLMRMKKAGYMCQNLAMFTMVKHWNKDESDPWNERYESPYDYALALSDTFDREVEINSDLILPACSGTEIEQNFSLGKMSALKTIEEGAVYSGLIERLKQMYDRGVRMTTLTWNFENELAFPNRINMKTGESVPETEKGLKSAGRDFVKVCSELGIIVDVSHLGDAGILEILDIMDRDIPIVASHSNARAVTPHPRNLTDDMIRRIADRGGVCGINFCADFINDRHDNCMKAADAARHIRYMADIAGEEAIGLGSDFDGIGNAVEFGTCEGMQRFAQALEDEGISGELIEKVFYKNVLRVYKDILG